MLSALFSILLALPPLPPSPFIGIPTFQSWEAGQAWERVKRDYPVEAGLVKNLYVAHGLTPSYLGWTVWQGPDAGQTIAVTPGLLTSSNYERTLYGRPTLAVEITLVHELKHINQYHFEFVRTQNYYELEALEKEAREEAARWYKKSQTGNVWHGGFRN